MKLIYNKKIIYPIILFASIVTGSSVSMYHVKSDTTKTTMVKKKKTNNKQSDLLSGSNNKNTNVKEIDTHSYNMKYISSSSSFELYTNGPKSQNGVFEKINISYTGKDNEPTTFEPSSFKLEANGKTYDIAKINSNNMDDKEYLRSINVTPKNKENITLLFDIPKAAANSKNKKLIYINSTGQQKTITLNKINNKGGK